MSHYTVGYHDNQNHHYEICEYAEDAYHAIKQASEDLEGFHNPHAAEYCIKEEQMVVWGVIWMVFILVVIVSLYIYYILRMAYKEMDDGSDGTTKQEELLQLSSDGD